MWHLLRAPPRPAPSSPSSWKVGPQQRRPAGIRIRHLWLLRKVERMSAAGHGAQRSEHRTHEHIEREARRVKRSGVEVATRSNARAERSYTAFAPYSSAYVLVRVLSVTHPSAQVMASSCSPSTRDQSPTRSGPRGLFPTRHPRISPGQRGCSATRGSHRITSSPAGIDTLEQVAVGGRSRAGFDPGGVWFGASPLVVTPLTQILHGGLPQTRLKAQVRASFRCSHLTSIRSRLQSYADDPQKASVEGSSST